MIKFKKPSNPKIFCTAIVILLLINEITYAPCLSYCYDKENLRAPVSGSGRMLKTLLLMPGRTEPFLNQNAFPDDISRKILSNIGITKESRGRKIIMDLSWTGVNDSIEINFISRKEFAEKNPIIINGQYRNDGLYRPFIKTAGKSSVVYTLPEDITLSELAYLIKDIDSLTNGRANRLELSNLFAERFKFTAKYLAHNIPWGSLQLDENQERRLKQQIELLYSLGCVFDRNPSYAIVQFEDILKAQFSTQEVSGVFIKYLKDNLNLTPDMLKDKDKITGWFDTATESIKKAVHSRVITELDFAVFTKGIEEMYHNIPEPYSFSRRIIRWFQSLASQPLEELLKDKLPIGNWKERLKNASPEEEIGIFREILRVVAKYKADKNDVSLDWSPTGIRYSNRLNCVGRTILIARIFREAGIKEDRMFYAGYPEHAFLILELADGSYCNVSTYRNSNKDTNRIDSMKKYSISNRIAEEGSIFYNLDNPIYDSMPKTKFVNISSLAEGLMSDVYASLAASIGNQIKAGSYGAISDEEQIKIRDIQIACDQKAIELNKNNQIAYYELGLHFLTKSRILKNKNPYDSEAVKLIDKSVAAFYASLKFTRNYPQRYCALGEALLEKSFSELDPDKISQYRRTAMSYFLEALRLDPTSKTALSRLKAGAALGRVSPAYNLDSAL